MSLLTNLGAILDNVLLDRFPTRLRDRAKLAVNIRYAHVLGLEDWTFMYDTANPVTVANQAALGSLPADFGVSVSLWDDQGSALPYLDPVEYYTRYLPGSSTGTPEAFTIINRDILVGPTAAADSTWTLFYRKRVSELVEETDEPVIPSEFRMILVHGGRAELLAAYNDPTSGDMEQQFQQDMQAMQREYLTDAEGQPSHWGADPTPVGPGWY